MRAGSNWRHLNGLSLGMMGDPVRCLPKVVHPDVAALKLQHNRKLFHRLLEQAVAVGPVPYAAMVKGIRGRKKKRHHNR